MKKITAVLVAVVLVAFSAITVFAAGINSSEQAVLDELNSSVTMANGSMVIPAEYVNQAENYFNTIDMTEDESSQIISIIKEGETFLANSGASNISDLSYAQKQELLAYGQKVVGVLGMTMTYDTASRNLIIYAPDGSIAFKATPTLTPAGQIVENPIKTTGADFNTMGLIVLGAVVVVLMGTGVAFVVKTKKERA